MWYNELLYWNICIFIYICVCIDDQEYKILSLVKFGDENPDEIFKSSNNKDDSNINKSNIYNQLILMKIL